MYFDTETLDRARNYKLMTGTVVPRPIAWVVTLDGEGGCNAAPFSFFNAFGGNPPIVGFSVGRAGPSHKDTLRHIRREGEFVVNLVSDALAEAMNLTAADFPHGQDELAAAGLATAPSRKVRTPHIAASPVTFECKLQQVVPFDDEHHNLVLGRVMAVHVQDDAVLNADRCYIDARKLDLIGRMQSPGTYTRTRDTFGLKQFSHDEWLKAQAGEGELPGRT